MYPTLTLDQIMHAGEWTTPVATYREAAAKKERLTKKLLQIETFWADLRARGLNPLESETIINSIEDFITAYQYDEPFDAVNLRGMYPYDDASLIKYILAGEKLYRDRHNRAVRNSRGRIVATYRKAPGHGIQFDADIEAEKPEPELPAKVPPTERELTDEEIKQIEEVRAWLAQDWIDPTPLGQ
ncbi:MAG: hypothetical protein ABSC17_09630 [Thermacetogeniaceae bacterium]